LPGASTRPVYQPTRPAPPPAARSLIDDFGAHPARLETQEPLLAPLPASRREKRSVTQDSRWPEKPACRHIESENIVSILDELDALKDRLDHDWDRLTQLQSHMVQTWALAYSANIFEELRQHRPIIAIHKLALVTKHADVVEVMGNDEVFSVRLYDDKLNRTSGPVLLDYPRGP
jgi:hypothetical protein